MGKQTEENLRALPISSSRQTSCGKKLELHPLGACRVSDLEYSKERIRDQNLQGHHALTAARKLSTSSSYLQLTIEIRSMRGEDIVQNNVEGCNYQLPIVIAVHNYQGHLKESSYYL